MKYILLLTIILFSCKKDPSTPSGTDARGSIEYKVNGSAMVIDNVDILNAQYVVFYKQLQGVVPNTRYLLNAQKGANNAFVFAIVTDSLRKINYHYDSTFQSVFPGFGFNYNGQTSGIVSKNDYFDINITDYSNGRISGNFTAALTPVSVFTGYGPASSVKVTEGKINNVQVIY